MAVSAEIINYSNREWLVDFETGDNSEPSEAHNSIVQAIRFILETERYYYQIMGSNFGIEWNDLVGADYDYLRSEIIARVKDAFSVDDRIISVGNFNFEKHDDSVTISMTVKTTLGNVNAQTQMRL